MSEDNNTNDIIVHKEEVDDGAFSEAEMLTMMKEPIHHHHHQDATDYHHMDQHYHHSYEGEHDQQYVDPQQYMTEGDEDVKLFDGFSFALAYQPQDEETIWKMEDLKKKIIGNEGTFHEQLNEKVNIILVLSTNVVDTIRINHAVKFSIPIVSEQYVHDCVGCNTRLDWNQYLVMTAMNPMQQAMPTTHYMTTDDMSAVAAAAAAQSSSIASTSGASSGVITTTNNMGGSKPPNAKANFQLKLFLKGSRQSVFTDQFPEVLYTLTWKHKYDVQIKASDKIFEGRSQSKILDSLEVALVLSQTNEIPVYDEEEKKRKRKRSKTDEMDGGGSPYNQYTGMGIPGLNQQHSFGMPAGFTGIPTTTAANGGGRALTAARGKKRSASSKNSNETVCVSSLHKGGDDEIVIRFGVNSTYCSKRFNYGAFKLYINYAPPDVSEDFHFTIYSAEFKTFVKKNANIAKYLHSPHPLNGIITVVTKAMTQKIKVEYAKYMTADLVSGGRDTETAAAGGKKRTRKLKKNKRDDDSQDEMADHMHAAAAQQYAAQMAMNPMGMTPGFDPNFGMFPFMQMGMMNPMATGMSPQAMGMMNSMATAQQQMLASAYMHGAALPSPETVPETPSSAISAVSASSTSNAPMEKPGDYQWYGEPIGINVNGDVFYYAFSHGDEAYKVGDFVFLSPTEGDKEENNGTNGATPPHSPRPENPEDWDKYWICKIINLVHTKMEGMKMIGQWFYRSSDLPDTINPKIPNELYVSFDINYNQLSTIRGKCSVRHCTQPDSDENMKYIQQGPHKHFFFRSGFNRLRAEVFELGEGVLRVLKEKGHDGEVDEDEEGNPVAHVSGMGVLGLDEHQAALAQQYGVFDPSAVYAHHPEVVHHNHQVE